MRFVSLLLLSFCLLLLPALAQTPKQVSVRLSVQTSETPTPRITLSWVPEAKASGYRIQRKLRTENQFSFLTILPPTDSTFTDEEVEVGTGYEYAVHTVIIDKDTVAGAGYVYTGMKLPPPVFRGQVLLLVDETMATPLSTELQTLQNDLENEGWIVQRKTVARSEKFNKDAVKNTKKIIRDWFESLSEQTAANVLLIGRVAVPYSGMNNNDRIVLGPDAHPEHAGAWAADAYYAFMGSDNQWTDNNTNDTLIGDVNGDKKIDTIPISPWSKNFPSDGKFDNAYLPGSLDIRIGRVDFYNMDNFKKGTQSLVESELELVRAYLSKNHDYRIGKTQPKMRALIDDNFGGYGGEHFARSGWMNFSVLVGRDNVEEKDWFGTLATEPYLWAYGCGGGHYQGAGGVGNTADFVAKGSKAIFSLLFGSYFGDWDTPNNFLRAAIASSPSLLTCAWAGRPFWYCHTMAMGESIGDAALLSQNADPYMLTFGSYGVHTGLMGDPTLRMNYGVVPPARNVAVRQVVVNGKYVEITWEAPSGANVAGYLLYKKVGNGEIEMLNSGNMVTATTFKDPQLSDGLVHYTVRAVGLINSTCGSFYDISYPATQSAQLTSSEEAPDETNTVEVYPNPARDAVTLQLHLRFPQSVDISVHNLAGNRVAQIETRTLAAGQHRLVWNMNTNADDRVLPGVYIVRVALGERVLTKRIIVLD